MTDTFQISTTSSLVDLETVLSTNVPVEPDWSYKPFAVTVKLQSGIVQGNGYPVIKWRFNQMLWEHREILRTTFCPEPYLSKANIYIRTPVTETYLGGLVWRTFKCILNWPEEDEDFQTDRDLGLVLTFTHCEVQ